MLDWLKGTKSLSERFIGRAGYCPKPVIISAKTADRVGHPFAGLVVDPHVCPDAFYSPRNAEYWEALRSVRIEAKKDC